MPAIVTFLWPTLLPQQSATLALLVVLIVRQRSLCLADRARGLYAPRDYGTRDQQLWRFTQNERLDSRILRRALAHTALASRAGHGQSVPIIIATTACRQCRIGLPQGEAVLPRRRRGSPRLWHPSAHGTLRSRMTAFQLAFLDDLTTLRAETRTAGLTPVLMGDRGFARSAIVPWCERHDWAYRVRRPHSWRVTQRW